MYQHHHGRNTHGRQHMLLPLHGMPIFVADVCLRRTYHLDHHARGARGRQEALGKVAEGGGASLGQVADQARGVAPACRARTGACGRCWWGHEREPPWPARHSTSEGSADVSAGSGVLARLPGTQEPKSMQGLGCSVMDGSHAQRLLSRLLDSYCRCGHGRHANPPG